ncbi:hypothetical protein ACWGLE_16030 [Streptomyces sp. NPDC055897]
MRAEPDVVFAADTAHGLVARSGWEQSEARTVLRDLGWQWEEHLHALTPPDDTDPSDAGVQAVLELHRHGHRAGYLEGPYGTMRLRLAQAEQVFTQMTTGKSAAPEEPISSGGDTSPRNTEAPRSSYGNRHIAYGPEASTPASAEAAPPL